MDLWALFVSALLSSTLLPGGSELLLWRSLQQGHAWLIVLILAALGNVLGSLLTYATGYWGGRLCWRLPASLRISLRDAVKARQAFRRHGGILLLFAWMPVLGDPLCLVAGVLRYSVWRFLFFVSLGKSVRYGVLVMGWMAASEY